MPTDSVILVESVRDGGRQQEFLIFVKGSCFNSNGELERELGAFCGKNSNGFEISYYVGITTDEFYRRFDDFFSRVNVIFVRNGDELMIQKKRFGVFEEEYVKTPEVLPALELPQKDGKFYRFVLAVRELMRNLFSFGL